MNTIQYYIHPDIKIPCYADDIAVWHSHKCIRVLEKVLNKTLECKDTWADDLKLSSNVSKNNHCIFSADRRHRYSFRLNINIKLRQIGKIDYPTYLGIVLDSELRFTKHIEHIFNKTYGKIYTLRKLYGTMSDSPSYSLRSTYCTLIRPFLDYAAAIWSPTSTSIKQKLDSVLHKTSKIITTVASSTNNEEADQEYGLLPLESRRNRATNKITNRLRCNSNDHISTRLFNDSPDA